jgi:hypothetical protein
MGKGEYDFAIRITAPNIADPLKCAGSGGTHIRVELLQGHFGRVKAASSATAFGPAVDRAEQREIGMSYC